MNLHTPEIALLGFKNLPLESILISISELFPGGQSSSQIPLTSTLSSPPFVTLGGASDQQWHQAAINARGEGQDRGLFLSRALYNNVRQDFINQKISKTRDYYAGHFP